MTLRATIPGAVVAVALSASSFASADPAASPTRADGLFTAAKQLRDAGDYEDACPKFAETAQLEPGVGVTLYLADCYQHTGRSANAWAEFRKAEQLARDRNDKRADVAKARADALEAKLTRMTIAVTELAKHPGLEIAVDGSRILPDHYNSALPTDPGDHSVQIDEPGQPQRTTRIHLNEGGALTVPVFGGASGAAPASGGAPASAPPPAGAAAPAQATDAPAQTAPSESGSVRTYIGYGLMGGGVVAVIVGAGLLDLENRSITKGHTSSNAGTFSGVSFALAGAAFASAIVLYLTAPKDRSVALTLSPAPIASGGGAILQGSF
jgi:serine/threonine-protein kinase